MPDVPGCGFRIQFVKYFYQNTRSVELTNGSTTAIIPHRTEQGLENATNRKRSERNEHFSRKIRLTQFVWTPLSSQVMLTLQTEGERLILVTLGYHPKKCLKYSAAQVGLDVEHNVFICGIIANITGEKEIFSRNQVVAMI